MNEYIALWKNFANFQDRTSRRGYWMAVLFNIIAILALSALEVFFPFIGTIILLYEVAVLIPAVAIMVRRLRDAGKMWYWIFLVFVPVIGGIVLLCFLLQGTKSSEGKQV